MCMILLYVLLNIILLILLFTPKIIQHNSRDLNILITDSPTNEVGVFCARARVRFSLSENFGAPIIASKLQAIEKERNFAN